MPQQKLNVENYKEKKKQQHQQQFNKRLDKQFDFGAQKYYEFLTAATRNEHQPTQALETVQQKQMTPAKENDCAALSAK